ncbi:MAG: MarR family winged helix-turn-helix transcriptional regulator [Burkholderiales bacterium]
MLNPAAFPDQPAPDHGELLHLDNQLCFALYSTSLAMTKLYKPFLAKLGMTYPQYLVMLALWQQDRLGVNALGARLHLDSGTLTPLLKRMQAGGWLTRQRDTPDERRVTVALTPAGRKLKTQAKKIPDCVVAASQCALPELVALTRQLQALRGQLALSAQDS